MLVVAAAGLIGMHRISVALDDVHAVIDVDVANESLVTGMQIDFKTQIQEWKNVLIRGKDPTALQNHWASFEKLERRVNETAAQLLAKLPPGPSRDLVANFGKAHETMGAQYRRGLEAFRQNGLEPSAGDRAVKGIDRAPSELLLKARKMIAEHTSRVADETEATARRAFQVNVVAIVLATVVATGGLMWLIKATVRAIDAARLVAETVASGDLSREYPASGNDELGSLHRALVTMNGSLARLVSGVRMSAESIATGSGQIASGSADLSQRTEEQAANLEQTAASIQSIDVTVKHTTDTAQRASTIANAAAAAATRGGEVVSQVIATMGEISSSSNRIGEIIGVIDGIAFQTNILALNAAVEAARAGEHGRGFAVVAAEVRSLAQRCTVAAKEIKGLINESGERVVAGRHLVSEAGGAMKDLVAQVHKVNSLIREISSDSNQESTGFGEIRVAIGQLDQVTQQNAALVEEAAAAAQSLKQQADLLVNAVGAFKLAA
jgi:methyl-accepting chemotaxis protein-1 (serine sensor receptor)